MGLYEFDFVSCSLFVPPNPAKFMEDVGEVLNPDENDVLWVLLSDLVEDGDGDFLTTGVTELIGLFECGGDERREFGSGLVLGDEVVVLTVWSCLAEMISLDWWDSEELVVGFRLSFWELMLS